SVLRLRLDQGPRLLAWRKAVQRSLIEPFGTPQSVLNNLHLLPRRRRQMRSPVDKGQRQGNRRYAAGQAGKDCMELAIELVKLWRLAPGGHQCRLGAALIRHTGAVF